jgi:hypothetical protein
MEIGDIPYPDLRVQFAEICSLSSAELGRLGLTPEIRDQLISKILLPEKSTECWLWGGGHSGRRGKARPTIWQKGKSISAYRVLMALLLRVHERTDLNWVLHQCPVRENCRCVNPKHLTVAPTKESGAKLNARDRSRYRLIHGDRNGSRIHPESRPRGKKHPKSLFTTAADDRVIQAMRATYDNAEQKRGIIYALSRHFGKSPNAVTGVVKRWRHNDVPDDPSTALAPSEIQINLPGDSARKRKHWPSGDTHKGTRMPLAAKKEFVLLFHRIAKRREKRLLIAFCAKRYGLKAESVQSLGYLIPEDFGAPSKERLCLLPKVAVVTEELLEATFAASLPLREGNR